MEEKKPDPNPVNLDLNKIKSRVEKLEQDGRAGFANEKIVSAAHSLRPAGTEHLGSLTVHIYKQVLGAPDKAEIVVQPSLQWHVPEEVGLAAVKIFRDRVMELYGHKAPELRS